MRRVFPNSALFFIIGIFIFEHYNINDMVIVLISLLCGLLAKLIMNRKRALLYIILYLSLVVGCTLYGIISSMTAMKIEPFVNQNVKITGEVCDTPLYNGDMVSLTVKTTSITTSETQSVVNTGLKIRVVIPNTGFDIKCGNVIDVECELKEFEEELNISGYNEKNTNYAKGIYADAYADSQNVSITAERPKSVFVNTREYVTALLFDRLPEDSASVASGLIFGKKNRMSDDVYKNFIKSGSVHIICVSGLHISIIISFVSLLAGIFYKNRKSISLAGIVAVVCFSFISGLAPSVMRASIMAIIRFVGILWERESDGINSISIAALILMILNPYCIYDLGFILSFTSTLGILLLSGPMANRLSKDNKPGLSAVTVGISAQAFSVVFAIYYFNGLSLVSVLSGVVLCAFLPFVLIAVLLFIFFAKLPVLSVITCWMCKIMIEIFINAVKIFADFPFSDVIASLPEFFSVMVYISAVIAFVFLFRRTTFTRINIFTTIILLFIAASLISGLYNSNITQVSFVNVGQGDCAFIKTPGKKYMLIDGGGTNSSDNYVGQNIVFPYIVKQGARKVDVAVVSHFHDDHCEGILTLMDMDAVKTVITPPLNYNRAICVKFWQTALEHNIELIEADADITVDLGDGVVAEILATEVAKNGGLEYNDENEESLGTMLNCGDVKFLFTGDMTSESQDYYLKEYNLDADVIKVPHHGANSCFNPRLLREVTPKYAVISVGNSNSYGLPSAGVEAVYNDECDRVFRTDKNGTVEVYTNGEKINKIIILRDD